MCGARRNGTGLITLRSSAVCITESKSSGDSGSGAWTSAASASSQQGELLSTACSVARWSDELCERPAPDANPIRNLRIFSEKPFLPEPLITDFRIFGTCTEKRINTERRQATQLIVICVIDIDDTSY